MPTPSRSPQSLKSRCRAPRITRANRPKLPRKDLLIIECNSAALAIEHLDLGTAYARLLEHELVSPFLPRKKTVELLKTYNADRLTEQFARAFEKHGRFRAILVVGHSSEDGLQLADGVFCDWQVVGRWLEPFEPQFVVLAACEAGRSEAVRALFGPLRKTLRDVYASPVKLYGTQAAALAMLIAMRLWYDQVGDKHSLALRVVNYINTGGQLYHWKRNETGPGQEIAPEFWDHVASVLDRGPWDLAQRITDFIQFRQRQS